MADPSEPERELEPIGEARRFACADGRERWHLPKTRAADAEKLETLGRAGIGGFIEAETESGPDERGVWLVRRHAQTKLAALLGTHEDQPLTWRPCVDLVASLAAGLAAAETAAVFPGVLRPQSVVIEPEVWIEAEDWVRARVGAAASEGPGPQLRREWLTPAAAAGEAEDAGSNRWLLGLLLYRLLTGRGPFAGLGLRIAIERLGQGVPPLPEEIARDLPPGLQSLILRILAPEPERRPATAAAIHAELRAFLTEPRANPSPPSPEPAPPAPGNRATPDQTANQDTPSKPDKPSNPSKRKRGARGLARVGRALGLAAVVGLGIAGAWGLTQAVGDLDPGASTNNDPETPPPATKPTVGSRAPLDADHTSPEDCASCHPRQTAEWTRSVMGHSAKSPLFQGLEILIEEQAGRSDECPGGAGVLRRADPRTACRDPNTGIAITGSGGALWCANCHSPRENLQASLPAWDGLSSSSASRRPLRDLQPPTTTEGIDCGFCHQVHGPVQPGNERSGRYEGNPTWLSAATGATFFMRPEDRRGLPGIANSGYFLDPAEFLVDAPGRGDPNPPTVPGGVHRRPSDAGRAYLASSQFCGACHDVRLFGADALATPIHNEPFRRLRNAYSEWADWAATEQRAGRVPADCQDCHMSSFPGICVPGAAPAAIPGETDLSALRRGCPPGTHFESRAPGERPQLRVAAGSAARAEVSTHYFSGVDIPLTPAFDDAFIDQPELDAAGIPLGGDQRRDLLLGRSFRFELGQALASGRRIELPIQIENTGAGHKIPAGFSQEREFWVHLRVTDSNGRLIYEVGRVDRNDEDLRDKLFARVNVDDRLRDFAGQPLGMFGANVLDGPDVPQWRPLDGRGGPHDPATQFRGRGLINLQNGFLRCVSCVGFIDGAGRCQPANDFQAEHRAARFIDAPFDGETGQCSSNLGPDEALFETYFPVGSLDAERGVLKGPDAIIDARSAPPGVPLQWTYELELPPGTAGPLTVEARLLFRAFPPFLVKAFADYEARQAAAGLRPSGPLVTREMLAKLAVVEIATVRRELPLR